VATQAKAWTRNPAAMIATSSKTSAIDVAVRVALPRGVVWLHDVARVAEPTAAGQFNARDRDAENGDEDAEHPLAASRGVD
jgi:hypothetical protein